MPPPGSFTVDANTIAHWDLNEASGGAAADDAGGYTLTWVNSPAVVTGISGNAREFLGDPENRGGYGAVPSGADLALAQGAVTIEAAFRYRSGGVATQKYLVGLHGNTTGTNSADNIAFLLSLNNAGTWRLMHEYGSGTAVIGSFAGYTQPSNAWETVACVRRGAAPNLYFDLYIHGALVQTLGPFANAPTGGGNARWGVGYQGILSATAAYFDGDLCEISVSTGDRGAASILSRSDSFFHQLAGTVSAVATVSSANLGVSGGGSTAGYEAGAAARLASVWHWLEIEGIPDAWGNFAATSSLFSGRDADERRDRVRAFSMRPPAGFDQRVDVLKATATIGSLDLEILDRDGDLALDLGLAVGKATNLLTITAELSAAATSFTVNETPDGTAYPTGGGTVYLNRETLAYGSRAGSTFSSCTRAMYGSTAAVHAIASIVSHYPRFLGQRNATVRYFLDDEAPSTAAHDAESIVRMTGIVSDAQQVKECTGYKLKIETPDRRIAGYVSVDRKRKLFDVRFKGTLEQGVPYRDGAGRAQYEPQDEADLPLQQLVTSGLTGTTSTQLSDAWLAVHRRQREEVAKSGVDPVSPLAVFNDDAGKGRAFFVRVGETESAEIMLVKGNTTTEAIDIVKRGCFGTAQRQHSVGSTVEEVMPISFRPGTITDTQAPEYYLPWVDDHPLSIALQLLLSTGTGDNYSGSGTNYDVLPANWGLGVPYAWIDVDEIERTRDHDLPGVRAAGILTEEFDLREWLTKEILVPFGCFPMTKQIGGTYSIRRLAPPMPLDTPTAIGSESILGAPAWDANIASVIGRVVYQYDYDALRKEFLTIDSENVFADALALYGQAAGTVEIKSSLLRQASLGYPLSGLGGGDAFVASTAGWWQSWFERPPPIVTFDTLWKHHLRDPGDQITLSDVSTPDPETGSRGIASKTFALIRKKPDDRKGVIGLSAMGLGIYSGQLRHIAPSARVTAWVAGTKTLTVDLNDYAAAGETDLLYDGVILFAVGYKVRVASPDLATLSSVVEIVSINTTTGAIVFDAEPTTRTPTVNDVLLFADYDDCVAAQRARFAFLADSARTLGVANDPAHQYVP